MKIERLSLLSIRCVGACNNDVQWKYFDDFHVISGKQKFAKDTITRMNKVGFYVVEVAHNV